MPICFGCSDERWPHGSLDDRQGGSVVMIGTGAEHAEACMQIRLVPPLAVLVSMPRYDARARW
jgi:hypothetical protein